MTIDLPTAAGVTELRVDVVPDRERVVIVPVGELDLASVPSIEDEVRELRARGFGHVVVDLRRLTFIDSSGLAMLLGLRNAARRADQRLELVAGPPTVQRVFELTATQSLFDWVSA